MSPSAPSSASPINSRAKCRSVSLSSRPASPGRPPDIEAELVGLVRERIGPVAAYKTSRIVSRLPKTRSGKVLRGTMRRIADGASYRMPATIDDPAILDEITASLREVGLARDAHQETA